MESFSDVLKKWENREKPELTDEEYEEVLRMADEMERIERVLRRAFFVPVVTKPLYLSKGYKHRRYTA